MAMKKILSLLFVVLLISYQTKGQIVILFATDSVTCHGGSDGSIRTQIASANSPFTYLWSDGSTDPDIYNKPVGTYTVTVTDALGDTASRTGYIPEPQGLHFTFYPTPANCGVNDGSATAYIQNGTPPLTYAWSNFTSGSAILNVPSGGYSLTVTDANGCTSHQNVIVPKDSNCFGIISGMAYFDWDSNCVRNGTEPGLVNKLIQVSPGYFAATRSNGIYSIKVDPGTYSLKALKNAGQQIPYTLNCGTGDSLVTSVQLNDSLPNQDFPIEVPVIRDVSVSITSHRTIPGANHELTIIIRNRGYDSIPRFSGYLELDSLNTTGNLINPPSNVTQDSLVVGTPSRLYFTVNNLSSYQHSRITVYTDNPPIPILNIGDVLNHKVAITPSTGFDTNPLNDTAIARTIVVAAYDPNDKQVFSNGNPVDGDATPDDTILNYLVRFQNTGNNIAYNVTVKDTLDSDLDPRTFDFIGSSHPCRIEFDGENIVHFIFDDINLVDTSVSYTESQGYLMYNIKVKDPEILDVPILNQAAIYFDYNPPIFTNTVQTIRKIDTTINNPDTTTVGNIQPTAASLSVYPNPTNSVATVSLGQKPINGLSVYDLTGKQVIEHKGLNTTIHTIHTIDLARGIYLLEVKSGETVYRSKLVVNKE